MAVAPNLIWRGHLRQAHIKHINRMRSDRDGDKRRKSEGLGETAGGSHLSIEFSKNRQFSAVFQL